MNTVRRPLRGLQSEATETAAALTNQAAIAEMLLSHGADLEAKDPNSNNPFFHTTCHNAKAAAKVIENYQTRTV